MVVDASALVAILTDEAEGEILAAKFAGAEAALTSGLAIYEAVPAIARKRGWTPKESEAYVLEYLGAMQVTVVPIVRRRRRSRWTPTPASARAATPRG